MQPKDAQQPKRLSAGVVVVHHESDEFRYLLLRVYRNWDFPKGMVEPDESPLAAAAREVMEETGLSNLDFRWGETFFETEPYAGGKIARYYVALAASPSVTLGINPVLGRAEHHEYRWMKYETARGLLVPRVRGALDWAHGLIEARTHETAPNAPK
jgi:8-oxo-dGTP pyrophosphatase MutT (NUDIX family)